MLESEMSDFFKLKFRAYGILVTIGALAGLVTVAGLAGRYHWVFDLVAHFPLQCGVVLLVVSALLAVIRKRFACLVFLGLVAVNGMRMLPQFMPITRQSLAGAETLKAMLINVQTESRGYAETIKLVLNEKPDFVFVEEVDDKWMQELGALSNAYQHVIAEPREDNFGAALLSQRPFREKRVLYLGDAGVPSLAARFDVSGQDLLVVGTHPVPPVGTTDFALRNQQLDCVAEYIRKRSLPTLLLGDLNVSPWSYYFRQFVRKSQLSDSSRGFGFQPTWPTVSLLLLVPIDHCLSSREVVVTNRRTCPSIGSDHYPLLVEFTVGGNSKKTAEQ